MSDESVFLSEEWNVLVKTLVKNVAKVIKGEDFDLSLGEKEMVTFLLTKLKIPMKEQAKKSATPKEPKSKDKVENWVEMEYYEKYVKENEDCKNCNYVSMKGENKNKVCFKIAKEKFEGDWRCSAHKKEMKEPKTKDKPRKDDHKNGNTTLEKHSAFLNKKKNSFKEYEEFSNLNEDHMSIVITFSDEAHDKLIGFVSKTKNVFLGFFPKSFRNVEIVRDDGKKFELDDNYMDSLRKKYSPDEQSAILGLGFNLTSESTKKQNEKTESEDEEEKQKTKKEDKKVESEDEDDKKKSKKVESPESEDDKKKSKKVESPEEEDEDDKKKSKKEESEDDKKKTKKVESPEEEDEDDKKKSKKVESPEEEDEDDKKKSKKDDKKPKAKVEVEEESDDSPKAKPKAKEEDKKKPKVEEVSDSDSDAETKKPIFKQPKK
jgi:hypothetical protein